MNETPKGIMASLIGLFLHNRVLVAIILLLLLGAGMIVQPFDSITQTINTSAPSIAHMLPRDRVAVDAIPDIGENQQIVFTTWAGRSPRDIDDQITYPLTTQLIGLPGVKTVRASSMFGFSSIYVIFEDGVDFYWSRARILEKLNALPPNLLPQSAKPVLGPDATGLGQVFWYTLEGRDPKTNQARGGWDLHELRTIQDWTVRYALQSAPGVSEVSSVGGHVMEYQVDVDPKTLAAYNISITALASAIKQANKDIGARTMEINRVEYVLRGVGKLESLKDLEQVVVAHKQDRPIRLKDIARVHLGPANRRGALDVAGAETVGGVVVARYGANPVEVIDAVQLKLKTLQQSLPKRTLPDGSVSQVTIVPFYNRAGVVKQTLNTLSDALVQQILITIIVVLILLGNLRSSMVISITLPLAVLGTFGLMKLTGVTANVMSLAGIAIAIGTMVDMGIVLTENILERLKDAETDKQSRLRAIWHGATEVAPAVATSVTTTVLSFLPVFGLTAAEGKLFHPLAFTKTYALMIALILAVIAIPSLVMWIIWPEVHRDSKDTQAHNDPLQKQRWLSAPTHLKDWVLMITGGWLATTDAWWLGGLLILMGIVRLTQARLPNQWAKRIPWIENLWAIAGVLWLLTTAWMPLGPGQSTINNLLMVASLCFGLLLIFWMFLQVYKPLLQWTLEHKLTFLLAPLSLVAFGFTAWLGFDTTFGWLPDSLQATSRVKMVANNTPGFQDEFMPAFDEGQFLFMPTVMPHASFGQALEQLRLMDAAIQQIPEINNTVGKLGRVDSALDPAPVSMFETIITYKPEWTTTPEGKRVRLWREHIKTPDDIWKEIVKATTLPGLTSAPKLMPINTRIIMLQSGMRANLGIQLKGPTLNALARAGLQLETLLKSAPSVQSNTVFAERVVGKPYLELQINREAIARYGLSIVKVQRTLQLAIGGIPLTTATRGRERFDVRVRYERSARMSIEALNALLVPTSQGQAIPLSQLATIQYIKGPQVIKSENTFLTSFVTFDIAPGVSEIAAVNQLKQRIEAQRQSGTLKLPEGVTFEFAGNHQNQLRSKARLQVLVPLALLLIMLVLYLQFRAASTSVIIYSGVVVAVSGGFILMWLYQQPWFLDVHLFGHHLRTLFHIRPYNMSVAVWVGVIALVGIATDDGVVMATYLKQRFDEHTPQTIEEIRQHVLDAGQRRVRPCLMTTATTLLALLPVITSDGRGADVMIPMAIPCIGGMAVELITLFVVPVLYCAREEASLLIKHTPEPNDQA